MSDSAENALLEAFLPLLGTRQVPLVPEMPPPARWRPSPQKPLLSSRDQAPGHLLQEPGCEHPEAAEAGSQIAPGSPASGLGFHRRVRQLAPTVRDLSRHGTGPVHSLSDDDGWTCKSWKVHSQGLMLEKMRTGPGRRVRAGIRDKSGY